MKRIKILNVVGARPNFIKIAPLMRGFKKHPEIDAKLVHTGQHYDANLSDYFFRDLDIVNPDYYLEVGSASHAIQTAKIMIEFEKVCVREKPHFVLVVGDVNSSIACALVATKLGIKVIHVEAGLRSFDTSMPEEINRILTDHISDFLFVSEQSGLRNLKHESINDNKVFFVGNTMIDSLVFNLPKIIKSNILSKMNLDKNKYILLTIHRPKNVDIKNNLKKLIYILIEIQKRIKIIYSIHPRTRKNIKKFYLDKEINSMSNLILIEPLKYIDFICLALNSKAIITDSGGIQEETTFLRIPCITLRENTERPITVKVGTNVVVGNNKRKIIETINKVLKGDWKKGRIPKFWDGKTSERIIKILLKKIYNRDLTS